MNVDKETIKQLLGSLSDYNNQANTFVGQVNHAIMPVVLVLLSIFWLIEFADLRQRFQMGNNGLSIEFLALNSSKFLIAFVVVTLLPQLVDSIVWFTSAIGHLIDGVKLDGGTAVVTIPTMPSGLHWYEKGAVVILEIIGNMLMWLNEVIVKILIFMQKMNLYIAKGIGGIFVLLFVSEKYQNIAISFVKFVAATTLNSVVIMVIIKMVPVLVSSKIFAIDKGGAGLLETVGTFFTSIAMAVTISFILFGSMNLTRRMMGA
jgi:hypothetical protein